MQDPNPCVLEYKAASRGDDLNAALILDRDVQVHVCPAHIADYMGAGFLADMCHSRLKRRRAMLHRTSDGRRVHRRARGSGMHKAQEAGVGAGGARGGHGTRSTGC